MPLLTIRMDEGDRHVPFTEGLSLRALLDQTDLPVRSGCNGMGACGLCRVRIDGGSVNAPTENEKVQLSNHQLEAGNRLACQVKPEQDLEISLLNPTPKANWLCLPDPKERRMAPLDDVSLKVLPGKLKRPYGVAVDLGTTHINVSVFDLSDGRRLAGRYGLNPQMKFGSDVMTRLVAASENPENAREISLKAIEGIGDALFDISSREGINLGQVVHVVLAGNTAMLALLAERNYRLLLKPEHWMGPIDCLPENNSDWADRWGIHTEARIDVIPPLGGFVGSDLLTGVLATRLNEKKPGSLFIDFGTNSEIALWDGRVLRVTSAAGGPAFEGSAISCGVPAGPGAIFNVTLTDNGTLHYSVLADSAVRGICGSGMVDLVAVLLKLKKISKTGRFMGALGTGDFLIEKNGQSLRLTKKDVDLFQQAKAAVGAGIRILMKKANMKVGDLQRICISGAFGNFLNVKNAQDMGLLPKTHADLVELCGNTALAGCVHILFSSAGTKALQEVRGQAELINLSRCPDFEDRFLESLYLSPMEATS